VEGRILGRVVCLKPTDFMEEQIASSLSFEEEVKKSHSLFQPSFSLGPLLNSEEGRDIFL
jgi:hypothetical protein